MNRLHYWTAINNAQREGFNGLAEAILELYRQAFPEDFA